jgi:hypothetical protein
MDCSLLRIMAALFSLDLWLGWNTELKILNEINFHSEFLEF